MAPDIDLLLTSNPRDEDFVRRIADRVREQDFIPWTNRDGPTADETEAALTPPAVAVCLGRSGREPWDCPAVRDCVQRMMKQGLPVVPVLLPGGPEEPDADLFPTLRDDAWVDFRGGLDRDEIDRLLWLAFGLQPSRRQRGETVPPPDLSDAAFAGLDPTVLAILRLAAFFAQAPISIELFEEGETIVRRAAGLLQEEASPTSLVKSALQSFGLSRRPEDPEPVDWAFADLADASLVVGREERMFTVPPEVVETVLDRMPEGERWRWIELAAQIVSQPNFFTTDRRSTPVFRLHVAAVIDHAEDAGLSAWAARLSPFLGAVLETEGHPEEAEKLFRHAVDLDTAAASARPQDVVDDLLTLANHLQETGRSAEAEPVFRQAVERAASYGQAPLVRVQALNRLGWLLLDLDRPTEAEPLLRQSLSLQEGIPIDPSLLRPTLRCLAMALLGTEEENDNGRDDKVASGLLEEAGQLLDRALALAEDCAGEDDAEAIYCRWVEAQVWQAQGFLEEAEIQMADCVEDLERTEGPDARVTRVYRKRLERLRDELARAAGGAPVPETL